MRILVEDLRVYCESVLTSAGVGAGEAAQVAEVLLWAETKGISSHGVRLLPVYLKRLHLGLVRSPAEIRILREGPSWVVLDCALGFGAVAGIRGVEEAVARASAGGLGAAWVRDSTHFGAAGYYTWRISRHGMIGVALTNAPATMAPWGAAEPAIGTNPIALAAPCGEGNPILLDIATSVVSRNTINLARERAAPIPHGWALDREGRPTGSPEEAAALLPFGEHKGSGLALFVEILCALVSGGASRREVGRLFFEMDRPEGSCHFFAAIDLGQVADARDYGSRAQEMARSLRGLRPAVGVDRVLLPGDREFAVEKEYLREGVPLDPAVERELFAAGDSLGVGRPAQALGAAIPPGAGNLGGGE